MSSEKDKKEGVFGDVIKKVVSIGVGAAFMTEEAVKGALGDLPLPKEVLNGLVQNAKAAKEEFTESVREEISNHLSKVDPSKMLEDVLDGYDVEVNATLKFKKKKKTKKS